MRDPWEVSRPLNALVAALQHRAAAAIGVDEAARTETVATMLENNRRRAPGYWIQLTLATGIATLGLVLGSTAVVIAAMLVSPLMGPIVELGMGFAVGSSFLALRASFRVILSVLVVVLGAALLTLALPFHEITAEIAARTAPTALDLLVAVFCALTAAYTTVRPAADTTSAAAGTAIGIALVPPLCVAGFGLGTGSLAVAGGAALLFTANFSAILVLAVLSFLLLGYNQVDAVTVEQGFVGPDLTRTGQLAARAHTRLGGAFGSKYGMAMRLIIPAVFLAAVYVPLSRALDEVTWQVRARDAIRRIVAAEAPGAVQTSLAVERHTVTLHLLLVGSGEFAAALERRLETSIAAGAGVVPSVTVTAVPDTKTLAAATNSRVDQSSNTIDIATIRQRVGEAIDVEWPTSASGPLAGWQLVVPSRSAPTIVVFHLGDPLGGAGEAILADRWSTRVGARVAVRDSARSPNAVVERLGREREWLAAATPALAWVGGADRAIACIKGPADTTRKSTEAQRAVWSSLRSSIASSAGRLNVSDSSGWSLRVAIGQCTMADSSARRAPPNTEAAARR
ncbi:MAG: DUF389 domain-containing protein [Gemmatimonadaceae bacterium]